METGKWGGESGGCMARHYSHVAMGMEMALPVVYPRLQVRG